MAQNTKIMAFMLKMLRLCINRQDEVSNLLKQETVELLQIFTEDSESSLVSQILCNEDIGILEVVSDLLTTNQSIKIKSTCVFLLSNLCGEPDALFSAKVRQRTKIV